MSKKSFKIVLDSDNTTSFNITEYDANYYIDLTKVIRKMSKIIINHIIFIVLLFQPLIAPQIQICHQHYYIH